MPPPCGAGQLLLWTLSQATQGGGNRPLPLSVELHETIVESLGIAPAESSLGIAPAEEESGRPSRVEEAVVCRKIL